MILPLTFVRRFSKQAPQTLPRKLTVSESAGESEGVCSWRLVFKAFFAGIVVRTLLVIVVGVLADGYRVSADEAFGGVIGRSFRELPHAEVSRPLFHISALL